MMRINKYLASTGLVSRRKAEQWVLDGRIQKNGETVTNLATQVCEGDIITLDGVVLEPLEKKVFYRYNKPAGFGCTHADPHITHTIYEQLPRGEGLFSVGRLDVDTEGLLLITNHGTLSELLSHPRYRVEKEYLAIVEHKIPESDLDLLRKGRSYRGVEYAPAEVFTDNKKDWANLSKFLERPLSPKKDIGIRIVLKEGKNREVRRLFESIGYPVIRLIRLRFGKITLHGLAPGAYEPWNGENVW